MLRDPTQFAPIKEELESLSNAQEPYVRIAAAKTLEMLRVAALTHDAIEDTSKLSGVQSYLKEIAPDIPYLYSYSSPYGPPSSGLRPSASGHIQFAVGAALAKLEEIRSAAE